jgi:LysM repeat protein
MNSSEPLFNQASAPDQKTAGRARVKVAVFSVIALHVAGLTALLLTQGCKREVPLENQPAPEPQLMDTNTTPDWNTNGNTSLPPDLASNTASAYPLDNAGSNTTSLPPVDMGTPVPAAAGDYVVQKGDSFYTIAKAHGTTTAAITAANPGVDSRRLKIGQKLVLPAASAAPAPAGNSVAPMTSTTGETTYTVKSGDTLTRVAARNGTTVKAIKSLNGLSTDRISVGQKLKIPVKAPAPAPALMPEPAPVAPPMSAPAPGTAPGQ